jgi:hypothetical protein
MRPTMTARAQLRVKARSLSYKNKSLIVMAVERKPARGNKAPGINQSGFVSGNARVALVATASSEDLSPFIRSALKKGTNMLTDGWAGYKGNELHTDRWTPFLGQVGGENKVELASHF